MTDATVAVLEVLVQASEPAWGLAVVAATGRPAGSVYPILARLEDGGWVVSRWDPTPGRGPRRRLYEFTDDGRAAAEGLVEDARRAAARAASTSPTRPKMGLA